MSDEVSTVDPLLCPLCQQKNHCGNLAAGDTEKTCWCKSLDIQFPAELLEKVPEDKKGKACICQLCLNKFNKTTNVGIDVFNPRSD
ncbi:MAG: cysteine-rich CWC family protein [Bermanella sp.]